MPLRRKPKIGNVDGGEGTGVPLGGRDDRPPTGYLEADPDPADPRMVLISCTDTGPGMSPATVAALMSGPALPGPTALPQAAGLGLGLALCRAFVHRHGGTLVIQSRLGAGTNVTVSLPAAPQVFTK